MKRSKKLQKKWKNYKRSHSKGIKEQREASRNVKKNCQDVKCAEKYS